MKNLKSTGHFEIEFDSEMMDRNITLVDHQVLQVEFIEDDSYEEEEDEEDEEAPKVNFKWKAVDFQNNKLFLSLDFENPLDVSIRESIDELRVEIVDL